MNIPYSFPERISSSSRLGKAFTWSLLFIIGLIAGMAIFFPGDMHWTYLINRAGQSHDANVRYSLAQASWNEALIKNLEISRGQYTYFFPQARVRLGLRPLFQAVLDTGPEMTLSLKRGKKISVLGEIDLNRLLPGQEIRGRLWIDADVHFQDWDYPPAWGIIEMKSSKISGLDNSMDIKDLALMAELVDSRLEIQVLRAEVPMEFTCSGHVLPVWDNPDRSTYHVHGHFILAGDKIPFEQQGRINELF